ncbi:CDGSH iron-sulfur domain-containing protein [Streptomyces xanthophaeus]|uniref:CDGSH iron-sulfur domain-containing protein n=1 Tax=Streptomyces xanthophaeus TaxID=67385 RepID=UPI00099C3FD2|nr:CDGSH iron-sulfur domain-containing protein [Streptomyces xanthophaeus]
MPTAADRTPEPGSPGPGSPEPGSPEPGSPDSSCPRARRVSVERSGPVLVEGPVEILLEDGTLARSDRFVVAVCTCRRSRTYPWCDTSHRPRERATPPPQERSPR